MTALIIAILCIMLYFAIRKPMYFLVLYGIFSSAGISGCFNKTVSLFSVGIDFLLLLAFISSCFQTEQNRTLIKTNAISTSVFFIILTIFIGVTIASFIKPDINIITYSLTGIGKYGSVAYGIWMNERTTKAQANKILLLFVTAQLVLSYLIVYAPLIGIEVFEPMNGAYYIHGGEYYLVEGRKALLSNFYEFILFKSRFFCCAQYGNANTLGIFAGAGMAVAVLSYKDKTSTISRIGKITLFILSFFMWTNSGERAVIYALLLAFIFQLYKTSKMTILKILVPIITIVFVLMAFDSSLFIHYFFGDGISSSRFDRRALIFEGLNYLFSHPFVGSAGEMVIENNREVFPHVAFLRVACLYGILPGIITFAIHIIIPIKNFLIVKINRIEPREMLLLLFSFGCMLSNAYSGAAIWLCFLAEYIISTREKIQSTYEGEEKL